MILNVEFRGIRTETTTYTKDNKRHEMLVNTLYVEQELGDGQTESIQLRLNEEQAAAFAGTVKGQQIQIDLGLRYIEGVANGKNIRGSLINSVRMVGAYAITQPLPAAPAASNGRSRAAATVAVE